MVKDILVARYLTGGDIRSQRLYENLGVRDHTFCNINLYASDEAKAKTAAALQSLMNKNFFDGKFVYEKHLLEESEE